MAFRKMFPYTAHTQGCLRKERIPMFHEKCSICWQSRPRSKPSAPACSSYALESTKLYLTICSDYQGAGEYISIINAVSLPAWQFFGGLTMKANTPQEWSLMRYLQSMVTSSSSERQRGEGKERNLCAAFCQLNPTPR